MRDLLTTNPALIAGLAGIAVMFLLGWFSDRRDKRRLLESGRPDPRLPIYNRTIGALWLLALICFASWMAAGFTLSELGFRQTAPGWRTIASWGAVSAGAAYMLWSVFKVATSRRARVDVRRQFARAGDLELIRPSTPAEHARFRWVSLTAGITEEIIFRGFLIGVLALAMPVWLAAVLATAAFVLVHIYQGPAGMLRILPVSALLAVIFVIGGSLWPVMILHALVDAISGGIVAITDRFEAEDAAAQEGAAPA